MIAPWRFDTRSCYRDGTVAGSLQKVTDFYVSVGGIQNPVPAKEYFDPSLYLEVVSS
jgi:NitT/TauT family transport system substrate-binding protein